MTAIRVDTYALGTGEMLDEAAGQPESS